MGLIQMHLNSESHMTASTHCSRICLRFVPAGMVLAIMVCAVSASTTKLDTSLIPAPVFEPEPGYVDLYWKAWELAYDHITTDDGAVQSPFMDEGRREGHISLWESAFTAQFTKYAPDMFPGIESLNEYYAQIHENATSSQTIEHKNNPPIIAWAEWEHFLMTGDVERAKWLLEEKAYLQKHFTWFHDNQQRQWNQWGKGYRWTHEASGMVNSPRGRFAPGTEAVCEGGGHAWTCTEQPSLTYDSGDKFNWLDAIAQQCLSAKCIHLLALAIGNETLAAQWKETWEEYKTIIDEQYYHKGLGKYVDGSARTLSDPQIARTPATFWTLVSEAATTEHAGIAVDNMIFNQGFFGDAAPFPSLIAGDIDADIDGRGWRGGVYPPLVYMGIQGLQTYGYTAQAARLARNMVEHMYRTYVDFEPHTIWEAYSPTERKPSTDTGGVDFVHSDYVGWSGLGPVSLFIEHVLGFHTIDAAARRVEWNLHWPDKHGIRRLSFGSVQTDILYESGTVTALTNEAYTLVINGEEHEVSPGDPVTISVEHPPAPGPLPYLLRYPVGQGTRVEAEGVVEYPVDTETSFYEHLCEWPWRFICECSQGWKIWCDYGEGTQLPPLPRGNALLMRVASGGRRESPMKWKVTVNGTVHSEIEGYGGEWQYLLLHDVPLTEESNTVNVATLTRNFLSLDFVEVLTLDPTSNGIESEEGIQKTLPQKNIIRMADGKLFVSLARSALTTVDIIDLSGRKVARLTRRTMPAGIHGLSLPREVRLSGTVYIVRLVSEHLNHAETLVPAIMD